MRWLWLVLAGCGRIGFDPATTGSPLADAPLADSLPTFTGPQPDPTLLPPATGQVEQGTPPGATLVAGESYADPITGVRIWRITDAAFPEANASCRTDQGTSGAVASAQWDVDHHTIALWVDDTRFLVDLERGTGTSNARQLFGGPEDAIAFSTDPAIPRLAYVVDFDHDIHRVDTQTATMSDVAPFPVAGFDSFPLLSAGARTLAAARVGGGMIAVDLGSSMVFEQPSTGSSEIPVLDQDGTFVTEAPSMGRSDLWRIGAASTTSWKPPSGDFAVSAGVTGGFVALDIDTGNGGMKLYFAHPQTATFDQVSDYGGYDTVEFSNQWMQTSVARDQQWLLINTSERGFPPPTRIDDAIGYWQLTGDIRLLAHHYGPDDASFYVQPRVSSSPDGRIVVFTSTMGTARSDVWAIEVPLSP